MSYIMDYITWRGDLTASQDEFSTIDFLILSFIPLFDMTGIISEDNEPIKLSEAYKKYVDPAYNKPKDIGLIIPATSLVVLKNVAKTKRFGDLKLSNYLHIIDKEKVEQCSAVTIEVIEDLHLIAYSGTDDTIVGWKENFQAMYTDFSEAQKSAVEYLEKMANIFNGKFVLFGHSKGGNLSLGADLFCKNETYKRINKVYSFDGQGIPNVDCLTEEQVARFKKVVKVLPDSSVVGRTFNHLGKQIIIKSDNKGVYQHDANSWVVKGKRFVTVDKFTDESDEIKELVDSTLLSLPIEDRKRLVKFICDILDKNEIDTLTVLKEKRILFVRDFLKINKDDKKLLKRLTNILMKDKAFRTTLFEGVTLGIKESKKKKKDLKLIEE